ncbi:restriction endonuclease subunit S [Candidatus Saccharibacteria bacterium]|nr:restriction endonuclease subunit S [Candidatus Saccharibacteria bacterium]MBI3337833.1 restriction endonuclease subunit S [Candidatus Saccharibacteria bacterium]
MSKTIKLGEVAEIQSGYSFRGAVGDDGAGTMVVQARDISALIIGVDHLPRLQQDFPKTKLLQKGDLLLTSRGSFRAGVARFDAPAVASSSLFTLHLRNKTYLPEFVALFLNSGQAQSYMTQNAKGATIQSLSISDLAELSLPVVPIERQKLLVGLQQNVETQTALLRSKLDVVNEIYIGAISKSLKGVA